MVLVMYIFTVVVGVAVCRIVSDGVYVNANEFWCSSLRLWRWGSSVSCQGCLSWGASCYVWSFSYAIQSCY